MAFVDWSEEALQNLADHDAWRVKNGWDPIALEIQDEVNAFFAEHDPEQPPGVLPLRSRGIPD